MEYIYTIEEMMTVLKTWDCDIKTEILTTYLDLHMNKTLVLTRHTNEVKEIFAQINR